MQKKIISLSEKNALPLSSRLEAILARQTASGHILPGNFIRKKIYLERKRFNLIYAEPRHLRKDSALLRQRGITAPETPVRYEYAAPDLPARQLQLLDEAAYQSLSPAEQLLAHRSGFLNQREDTLLVALRGYKGPRQSFKIGANFAPLGNGHFVVWQDTDSALRLRQVYQGINQLYWIDDLLEQLGNPDYRLFFSAMGTGNSTDILHFQVLKEKFPVFAHLGYYYSSRAPEIIFTSRSAWPFKGFLARYTPDSRKEILGDLTARIKYWLGQRPNNTFNLLAQQRGGLREIYFVKRKYALCYMQGMSNSFSGYEVAGNIVVEDFQEYLNFPAKIPHLHWANDSQP
ncbi:MAG: hypothetical protein LBQ83_03915 [Candidatus Margulisbacteria bacterium]|jgi:hypothetical protein|nr:hypothetical protein [Candidatus Margulisiibacteriota bacterium]